MKTKVLSTILLLVFSSALFAVDADEYLQRAKRYIAEKDYRSGIIELKNALQKNPKSAEARLTLGTLYLNMGDPAAAQKELERARDLNASRDQWLVSLTRAYLLQQKFTDVMRETDDIADLPDESRLDMLVMRGEALLKGRQLEGALSTLQQAAEIDPKSAKVRVGIALTKLAGNDIDGGMADLNAVIQDSPDNSRARTLRGSLLSQQKQFDAALEDFNRALDEEPNNVQALLGRSVIRLRQGESKLAKKDIDLLDTIVPGHPQQNFNKAHYYYLEKNYDESERSLQEVLRVQPNHLQSQLLYGVVSYQQEKFQIANEYLTKVKQALPNHLPVIKLLSATRTRLNKNESVISLLEPAVKAHPQDAQLTAMLGTAYMKAQRYDDGAQMMQRAIELSPDLAAYRAQLAMGLLAQGKTGDAIQQLQTTVGEDDDFMQADMLLVMSLLRDRQPQKALEAANSLQKKMPYSPVGFNLAGLAYAMDKQNIQAEEQFNKALELDPGFTEARVNLARLAYQNNDKQQARQILEQGLKETKEHPRLLMALANLAELEGDTDKMQTLLARAMEGKPSLPEPGVLSAKNYLQQRDALKALKVAGETFRKFPDNMAVLEVYGKAQLMAGQPDSAVTTFQRMVNLNERETTLSMLADSQKAAKQIDPARETFNKILALNPDSLHAQTSLISLDLMQKNYKAAIQGAKALQQAKPDLGVGFELEAMGYAAQRQFDKSIPAYQQAMQKQPNEKLAIQLARQHFAAGDIPTGQTVLIDWIEKSPKSISARINLGMSLQSTDNKDAAIEQYEAVLQQNKDNVLAMNNLAWLYAEKGDERGVGLAQQAYDKVPKNAAIADTYGWILAQSGDYAKAVKVLREASDLAPDHQEIGYHLGFALAKENKKDEAKITLQRVIRLEPDTQYAKSAQALLDQL